MLEVLIFCLNQISFTPNELVRWRRRAIRTLRAFQVGLSASPLLVENGDWFGSQQKGTGAESNNMETSKWSSFCFLPGVHYWCQV